MLPLPPEVTPLFVALLLGLPLVDEGGALVAVEAAGWLLADVPLLLLVDGLPPPPPHAINKEQTVAIVIFLEKWDIYHAYGHRLSLPELH